MNDESAHHASWFAIVAIGCGWLKIPPHRAIDIIPSVMRRHEGYVERRTKSVWFYGFAQTVAVSLACLELEAEDTLDFDFSQLSELCDSFGSFGVNVFGTLAKALSVGRAPMRYVGKLNKEMMDEVSVLLYRFLCEVHNLPCAHFECGLHYSVGSSGRKQDFFKAFEHFERGAEADHDSCLYSLAAYYNSGIGGVVEPDKEYAISLRARMTNKDAVHLRFFFPDSNDSPELFDGELLDVKAAHAAAAAALAAAAPATAAAAVGPVTDESVTAGS